MEVEQLQEDDKWRLDELIDSVEHRVKLQHILEQSDAVRQLFREFQQLLDLLHRATVVFQRFPLQLSNLDAEDENDDGIKALSEVINAISKTSRRYQ